MRRKLCNGEAGPLILHSGRLIARKKLPILFDALWQLKRKGERVHLVIVGDGPERPLLEQAVEQRKLAQQVSFWGSCYDEETLATLFLASDLAVAPGAMGLFAIHSLSYGLPIITNDNRSCSHRPEVEAVIRGRSGDFFEEDNAVDLARVLARHLSDEDHLARMRASCIDIIEERYTPAYQVRVLTEAVGQLLR
jgi:glycosyltransferase involved in cell wall biosynthesis